MLTSVVVLGLAAFFASSAIRRLPVIETWTLMGVKPFACNLCMALWTGLAWVLVARTSFQPTYFALVWAGSSGIGLLMLEWSESLTAGAPPPPAPPSA